MIYRLETLHKIFEAVEMAFWESGGDGWASIISEGHHREMADLFEKYARERAHPLFTYTRTDYEDGSVTFMDNQEGVTFASNRNHLPTDFHEEIVVELW